MNNLQLDFKKVSGPSVSSEVMSVSPSESSPKLLKVGSLFRTWTEVSRINYTSTKPLHVIKSGNGLRRKSIGLQNADYSLQCFVPSDLRTQSEEELFAEQFPVNVTSLMNEDQLWGCFYVFPELYADVYSPVVRIRKVEDVESLVGGVLTRDMVTACLSYLKKIPILKDYVYIKLDLSMKYLVNIQVLQHYKFLVYLDLSTNYLMDLSVLSHLLYLQYLSVAFNCLESVLDYDPPQWFLTEVHYKYNQVSNIRDLSSFWSIAILDLSHNKIKSINGLENLMHLRRLDLSFNNISRLENLSHLRLLWLDVSYNSLTSFELGADIGLRTLLHLEYLNLSNNKLTCMKLLYGCTRLRELHARNNGFSSLLELNLYMRQLRRLIILDLRSNPVCEVPGYKSVVTNIFPVLLCLDAAELDPVEQRSVKLETSPDVESFASRRLLRLLYVEQLRRARVSPSLSPADTVEVPLVVFVGEAAVGKGTLARRLALAWGSHVARALLHTTADHHCTDYYLQISRSSFDEMLLDGDFLTYSEINGESYGLSREEAAARDGRVRVACMDLPAALMLRQRGLRPYLILATCLDKCSLAKRQMDRKTMRLAPDAQVSCMDTAHRSTLQGMLSGRILVTGILNEILLTLPEEKSQSEFQIESQCSLLCAASQERNLDFAKDVNFLTINTSSVSLYEIGRQMLRKSSGDDDDTSICSLYKDTDDYSDQTHAVRERRKMDFRITTDGQELNNMGKKRKNTPQGLRNSKSVDFSRQTITRRIKDLPEPKSKSVSIIQQGTEAEQESKKEKSPSPDSESSTADSEDMDLWLAFLIDNGLIFPSDDLRFINVSYDLKEGIMGHPNFLLKDPYESLSTSTRDSYETIHRNRPGLFWDTITMDDPDKAFKKAKTIIRNIVNSQPLLKPMFDVDFANDARYPNVQERLASIRAQIAPQQLFH